MKKNKKSRMLCILRMSMLVLLLAASLALVSCGGEDPAVQSGIKVEEDPQYTYNEETKEYAQTVLYSVLYAVWDGRNAAAPSKSDLERMENMAASILRITANGSVSEEKYLAALRSLYAERDLLVSVVAGERPLSALKGLYSTLSDLIGRRYVGECVYEALMQSFRARLDSAEKSYEESGSAAHLVIANRQKKNIEALSASIGIENLSRLLDYAFLISDLSMGGVFDAGGVALSDGEMLMLLTYLDPSELTVGREGWEMLFSLTADTVLISDQRGFFRKMHFAAAKNGDGAELSEKMDALIALLPAAQSRLNSADIALIRAGRLRDLLIKQIEAFSAEEFSLLDEVFSISFENTEYSALAAGVYGAPYAEFLASYSVYTLEQVIAAKGTVAFENTLKGYIAGKCPALAYAMLESR